MNKQSTDARKENSKRDPDLVSAERAMKRAARKAREKASQVGRGVFVLKDGEIVEDRPDSQLDA